jgi:hypothetical protein
MTLVELLVAFVILLLLVGALVTLTTRSLETWTAGETRKDVYDRARVVLDAISDDLRSTYSEGEFLFLDQQPLQPPAFAADLDAQRRPRLRFIRSGDAGRLKAEVTSPPKIAGPMWYTPTWEVAYVAHPERPSELWRGIRFFDRKKSATLLNPIDYARETDSLFRQHFRKVESGVLYVGYRFWTQYTTTWDDSVAVTKVKPGSRERSGPEDRWDSTRRTDPEFYFHRPQTDLQTPDFVYPEIVQVTVTIETMPPDLHGVRLLEPADERATYLRLSHTRGLPEAPGAVKLGNEWIEYGTRSSSDLGNLRRGSRGTKPQGHSPGAPVLFGETFTTEVRIPAYRESQSP